MAKSEDRVVLRVRQGLAQRVKARAARDGVTISDAADAVVAAGLGSAGPPKGIKLDPALQDAVAAFALARGVPVGDAIGVLVRSGLGRLAALSRYAEKQRAGKEGEGGA